MEDYIERIRKALQGDSGPKLLLLGSSALLAIVVITDLAGARNRAPDVRETLRTVQAEQAGAPSVPSVASVPRDLASEAMLAARVSDAPEEAVIAEAAPDATDDMPEVDMAEVDAAEVDAAEVDMAEDAKGPAAELAEETELAEVEMSEEAPEDLAAEDMVEDAETEVAQAEASEEAPAPMAEEMAAEPAAEEAPAETELAEAEPAETEMAEASDVIADAAGDVGDLALLASADVSNGQRVWRQCGACHVFDAEQNRGGPHLVNIIGREIGVAEGWRYSRALSEHGGVWTVEGLLAWLENPDAYIPGNQMAFRGLRNEQDRIDVLGFLNDNRQD